MANTVVLTKRLGGGFTANINGGEKVVHMSLISYISDDYGVYLTFVDGIRVNSLPTEPSGWTIGGTSGFTTILDVCDALDAIGVDGIGDVKIQDQNGNPTSLPDLTDTTSSTIMYEGYKYGSEYKICKIDLSTPIIVRLWATGSWENRAALLYS